MGSGLAAWTGVGGLDRGRERWGGDVCVRCESGFSV